jgi:hypothetical protein
MKICLELFKDGLKKRLKQIMGILYIEDEKNNSQVIEKLLKPILMEFFVNIFESEKYSQKFFTKVTESFGYFVNDIDNFTRNSEFDELVRSCSFKNLINKIKRIILFAEFHDPSLNIKIDILEDNNVELRTFKASECICIDGLVKDNKNYLVLLSPPLLKNGYPYQGLKPMVIMYDIKLDEIRNALDAYINDKPRFHTENKEESDVSGEEKVLKQSLSNFEFKTVNIDNVNANSVKSAFNSFKANNTKKYFPNKNKTDVFFNDGGLVPSVNDSFQDDNKTPIEILVVDNRESKVIKNTFGNKFINNISTPKKYFNINPKKNDMIRTKTMDNMIKGKEASKGYKPNHTINTQQLGHRSTSHNDINGQKQNSHREKQIQSSRTNYEPDDQTGNEVADIIRGHHSIYNSFTVNKKGEVGNQTIGGFNKTTSGKKAESSKYLFQTAETGQFKPSDSIVANVFTSIANRNISKTPCQSKPKVTAYSPRSNIGNYMNDRLTNQKDTLAVSRDTSFSKETGDNFNCEDKHIKKRKHNSYITSQLQSSNNKSHFPQGNLKNHSVDRRMFENKTNAHTKISISQLLSFKKNDKGRIVNTTTTFKDVKKASFISIKYV